MIAVRRIAAQNLLSPTQIGGDYTINPYRGCPHKCIYCYAACINHSGEQRSEEWGERNNYQLPITDYQIPIVVSCGRHLIKGLNLKSTGHCARLHLRSERRFRRF